MRTNLHHHDFLSQKLLVWFSLCLWSWFNGFPCDSEMWSLVFSALWMVNNSPTLCTHHSISRASRLILPHAALASGWWRTPVSQANTCQWEIAGRFRAVIITTLAHGATSVDRAMHSCMHSCSVVSCACSILRFFFFYSDVFYWNIIHSNKLSSTPEERSGEGGNSI